MKKCLFVVLCICVSSMAWGQNSLKTQLTRHLNRFVYQQQRKVQIILDWKKIIRARDLLTRPARGGAGNTVVGVKTKQTYCRGYYTNKKQVVFSSDCIAEDDFKLAHITLLLPNGQKISPTVKELHKDKSAVWVIVS